MHDSDERVQEKQTIADERPPTGIRLSNVGNGYDDHRFGAREVPNRQTRERLTSMEDFPKIFEKDQNLRRRMRGFSFRSRNVRVRQTPHDAPSVRLGIPMPRQPPYMRSRARRRRVIRFPVSAKGRTRIGSPVSESRAATWTNRFVAETLATKWPGRTRLIFNVWK